MSAGPLGRVLIVAGSDPSGGAGIQADIKTVTALGGYAAAAISALTVQNTQGVSDILPISADFVASQMGAVLSDIGADCIKVGMLPSAACIDAILAVLEEYNFRGEVIVDPVMVATSGDSLADDSVLDAMRSRLIPRATIVTPNMPEAALLTGLPVESFPQMQAAAAGLMAMGSDVVLLKGGHMQGNSFTDFLLAPGGQSAALTRRKIDTRHTHGTGCTLASALATLLAQGERLDEAFEGAHKYVRRAIELAPGLGAGHGPLGHAAAGQKIQEDK